MRLDKVASAPLPSAPHLSSMRATLRVPLLVATPKGDSYRQVLPARDAHVVPLVIATPQGAAKSAAHGTTPASATQNERRPEDICHLLKHLDTADLDGHRTLSTAAQQLLAELNVPGICAAHFNVWTEEALPLCPILLEPPANPARTADGHIYDADALAIWFTNNTTSPCTGLPLHNLERHACLNLSAVLSAYKAYQQAPHNLPALQLRNLTTPARCTETPSSAAFSHYFSELNDFVALAEKARQQLLETLQQHTLWKIPKSYLGPGAAALVGGVLGGIAIGLAVLSSMGVLSTSIGIALTLSSWLGAVLAGTLVGTLLSRCMRASLATTQAPKLQALHEMIAAFAALPERNAAEDATLASLRSALAAYDSWGNDVLTNATYSLVGSAIAAPLAALTALCIGVLVGSAADSSESSRPLEVHVQHHYGWLESIRQVAEINMYWSMANAYHTPQRYEPSTAFFRRRTHSWSQPWQWPSFPSQDATNSAQEERRAAVRRQVQQMTGAARVPLKAHWRSAFA